MAVRCPMFQCWEGVPSRFDASMLRDHVLQGCWGFAARSKEVDWSDKRSADVESFVRCHSSRAASPGGP